MLNEWTNSTADNLPTRYLLYFYTHQCSFCVQMEPVLNNLESFNKDFPIYKINSEIFPEMASKYFIRGVPALVMIKGENVVWNKAGVVGAADIHRVIKNLDNEFFLKTGEFENDQKANRLFLYASIILVLAFIAGLVLL